MKHLSLLDVGWALEKGPIMPMVDHKRSIQLWVDIRAIRMARGI